MRTNRDSNRRSLGILAPALVVWAFLALASGVQAQNAAPAVEAGNWADQTLRVSLWLNKNADEVYRRGEPLNVTFQTNDDAYAVVYHIDVEGRVSVLWPTSRFNDGFVFGGHQYRLPARGGERMRAGDREGQGFFHTVVSQYPFDLRDLELDFHHEEEAVAHDFYVAGDPYLAMNEVNFAVTGLEDPSEYAISNFVDYYVHRVVDHPRYMCFQCHDGSEGYEPYRDHCPITIEADYTWVDQWWDEWGYFPPYVMPVYVYVDPWTHDYWVNYWYRPWYRWPHWGHHHWHYTCWDWHHSPYWRHDVYVIHQTGGHPRYRPLDRDHVGRDRGEARTKNELVTNRRPADDRIRDMKDRKVLADTRSRIDDRRTDDRIRGGGGTIKNDRKRREQTRFEEGTSSANRERTSPGLRIDQGRSRGSSTIQRPTGSREGRRTIGRAPTRVGKPSDRTGSSRVTNKPTRRDNTTPTVKPNQNRSKGGVWSIRRTQGSSSKRPTPPPSSRTINRGSTNNKPKTIDRSRGSSSSRSSNRSSGTSVKPRTSSKPPSKPATPPPSRGSSGSKKSSGGSKAKRSSGGRG